MATRVVTVDIDSRAIRLLQVEGNRVERWATSPLEAGIVEDGAIVNPEALAAHIRRLQRSSGIMGREVTASISGLFSIARTLSFPLESRERVFEQARESMPGGDLRLLWQTMRVDGTGQAILALGANEQQVNAHIGALRAAGLAPQVVEFKTVALSRMVNRREALIVNLEPSSVDLVLVANGLPQVMRTVALPGTPSTEEWASRVARTLEHTTAYYNSRHADHPLPPQIPLFLVGPGAEEPSLRQQIEERVEYSLETLDPALEFPPHLPIAQYAVNMGLALRHMPRPEENGQEADSMPILINLAPRSTSPWRLTPQRAAFLGALAAGLVLTVFLLQLGASAGLEVERLQADVRTIEQEVNLRRGDLTRLTQVEASVRDFEKLTAPWGRVTGALDAIQEILTPGIQLSSIEVDAGQAKFMTRADSSEEAMHFVEALRADGRFGWPSFNRVTTAISASLNMAALKPK